MSEDLRRAFVSEARRRLAAMERKGGDPAREAHTLRGSAAVVELPEIEELAGRLETALGAGDDVGARRLTAALRAHVEALTEPGAAAVEVSGPAADDVRAVLYIEDSRPNALLVQRTLAQRGIRMLDARTGEEGIRLARAERPGLVLLDARLPDMDGAQVLRRLRGEPATAAIPVVVVTGGIEPEAARELSAAGVHAILGKPFPLERLLALVDDALGTA